MPSLSVAQVRSVIDGLADAFFIIDPSGRLAHANPSARALLTHYSPGRLLSDCLGDAQLFSPTDGPPEPIEKGDLADISRQRAFRDRLVVWRRPGEPDRELSLSGGPVRDRGGRVLLGVLVARDVTERRQHGRDREAVAALAGALVDDLSLDGVVRRVLDEVRAALRSTGAAIVLATPDGAALELAGTNLPAGAARLVTRVPADGPCACARAYRTAELQVAEDLRADPAASPQQSAPDAARRFGAVVAAPLRYHQSVMGALLVLFAEPRWFAARELKLVTAMADIAAAGIQSARMYAAALQRERHREVVGRVLAAINSTIDVDEVPRRLVDEVLTAFGADRAWLLYPCDPTSPTVTVPYEAAASEQWCHPGHPDAISTAGLGPMLDPDRHSAGTVAIDVEDPSLPQHFRELHRAHRVQSILAARFQPRADRPWLLGLHQCSHRRVWTPDERSLLAEIAGYAAVAIENAQLHKRLKDALRLREEFVSSAAHELKTPVTALKGYAQLLLRAEHPDDEMVRRGLQAIDHSVNRITRLAHDLLEVASLEMKGIGLRRSEFDLGELACAVVADLRAIAGQRVIACDVPVPVRVCADPDRIADVLFSLIDNAVKYSPAASPVEVSVVAAGGEAVVSVRDHGRGIPPERWPHLFEPLYEPHPPGGAGYVGMVSLGLYLARRIVEEHGGRIWFEPEERGSTFHVALPLRA